MRATTNLALLALTTGSANAIFCFVKEQKCLPGVELSVDYDEIGTILGITKSSTMTGTATQTESASSATSVPEAETTLAAAVPTSVAPDFLDGIFPQRSNATPAAPGLPSTSPTSVMPGFLGDLFRRGSEEVPPQAAGYLPRASLHQAVDHPVETRIAPPAYVKPSYHHTIELLPAPSGDLEAPRFNLTTSKAPAAPPAYTDRVAHVPEIPTVYATQHALKSFSPVASETHSSAPAYTVNTQFVAHSSAGTHLVEHTMPPVYHNSKAPSSTSEAAATSTHSHSSVPSKYATDGVVDVTTTVTEWITVTPTETIALPKPTASQQKESHDIVQPKPTPYQKETHVVGLPQPSPPQKAPTTAQQAVYSQETHPAVQPSPSAPKKETTPEVVKLTKTVDVWVPPTWMSIPTAAVYTASQEPSVVPVPDKSEIYPVPSNSTTLQATATKPIRPTVYVTPVPAAQSSWAWTQNPEEYTGAATTNSLGSSFMVAAALVAMMMV